MTARIVIAAGGTGGHVFPALAIAAELRRRGAEVIWLAAGGMEMRLAPENGYDMEVAPFSPPRGIGGVLRLAVAVWRARLILKRRRASAVLGMGGYAAAPAGLAARTAGIPLVVHEQNATAGRANRLLCKVAKRVLTGFPDAIVNAQWSGNPARAEFFSHPPPQSRMSAADSAPRRILVLGGSQGAGIFNEMIPEALSQLPDEFSVVHQCGRGHLQTTEDAYRRANRSADIAEFRDDVALQMASADLIVCRAGAATLAEVAAIGAAALLIPYPFAAAGHQQHNAEFFARQGAAFMRSQHELDAKWLAQFLSDMTYPMLQAAAQKARELAKPDAAQAVASACLSEARHAA